MLFWPSLADEPIVKEGGGAVPLLGGCEASVAFKASVAFIMTPVFPIPLSELEGAGLLESTELHLVQRVVLDKGGAG